MFNKINMNEYTMDKDVTARLLEETKQHLPLPDHGVAIAKDIYEATVATLMCHRIAMLVVSEMKDELIRQGFVSISYSCDHSGLVSVGWINDELAYGELIK